MMPFIWSHGVLRDSGLLRSSDSSMARRKAILSSNLKSSAWEISVPMSRLISWTRLRASCSTPRICSLSMLCSSER